MKERARLGEGREIRLRDRLRREPRPRLGDDLAELLRRLLRAAEAEERDFREIERIEKGGPIAIADYTLVNDDSVDKLLAELDALLQALGIRQPTDPDASA